MTLQTYTKIAGYVIPAILLLAAIAAAMWRG